MRKKSHISLAMYIVGIAQIPDFDRHKKAFYVGSILPDCKPSFLTRRHEIGETFYLVEKGIGRLTTGYHGPEDYTTMYFARLGEVLHYIADYFTYPHNKEYPGTMKQHCVYEGQLKLQLRRYIRNLQNADLNRWKMDLQLEKLDRFKSTEDICDFLREEHRRYIRRGRHSVEMDCRYIVGICTKVAMAIFHINSLSVKPKQSYAVAS